MNLDDNKVQEILLNQNYITKVDLEKAKKSINEGASVVDYFLDQGILTKKLLGQALAEAENVHYFDLKNNLPSYEQILKFPEEIAREYRLIFTKEDEEKMFFTSDNPTESKNIFLSMGELFPVENITVSYSLPEDIDFALDYFYKKPLKTRFSDIIKGGKKVAQEIVNEIFNDALAYNSSDVHFEPQGKETIIRFRVDGVLQEAGRISNEYYSNILNFIKVQGGLRIDEHYSAQDGSMSYKFGKQEVDMRLSILPVVGGEKIAIRILAKYIKGFSLHEIGLEKRDRDLMRKEIQRPFGMILTSGPTGSGKTTTLYSLLRLLNNPRVNITTLEDPIEYRVKGINQIQVNQATNLTFLKGLRTIVRQDPDVIMVGEIRDEETAEMAVNASLTGHLLLSTFHANDAATTIARLLDMNIEPFLLASTLRVVVAQRLVRKLCEKCRYSVSVSKDDFKKEHPEIAKYLKKENNVFYQSHGCESCGYTGYNGRTAIFEIILNTPELQDLILNRPSAKQIWELAKKQDAKSLFADGMEKVKAGVTSLDDLLRVALP
ncbi:MAG: ATPase, T2SS/T4P/T4SS family [Patescibacteria group bacterium]|nr:type II/IV secretion system protein [Patescibacteria group bacterium]